VCALSVGPKTEHKGKPLSQDAVIWIQVRDMK
jgi:cobalt/nickel transport protein